MTRLTIRGYTEDWKRLLPVLEYAATRATARGGPDMDEGGNIADTADEFIEKIHEGIAEAEKGAQVDLETR